MKSTLALILLILFAAPLSGCGAFLACARADRCLR
jgi:hypothetical protein